MKINKNQLSNIGILLFLIVFIFTPVGTTIKIWVNKAIAFNPSVISEEKRETLTDYNWVIKDLVNNTNYSLNTAKGEVILINFWATWCPPCIAEMPDLQELYNDYGDKVTFLFVTNEDRETVSSFFTKRGYNLPAYQALSKAPEQLYSRSIPATYLINKQSEIVINKTGTASWNSKKVRDQIDQLLSE